MITLVSGIYSLSLPNPELRDLDTVNFGTIVHRTMGGDVRTYINTTYVHQIRWEFIALTKTEYEDTKQFLDDVKGNDITYTDWFDDEYAIKILTSNIDSITQIHEYHDLILEVEFQ